MYPRCDALFNLSRTTAGAKMEFENAGSVPHVGGYIESPVRPSFVSLIICNFHNNLIHAFWLIRYFDHAFYEKVSEDLIANRHLRQIHESL